MNKTLNTIQKLYKLAWILCKIAFITCTVSFCICLAGILSIALGAETLKFGGVTLERMIQTNASLNLASLTAAMTAGAILCAGRAVLSKFAELYFKHELADGSPFTLVGAKEMQRLGILTICIPLGTQIVAEIVYAVMEQTLQGVAPFNLDSSGSISLGIMFLVMSLLCRYGAEQIEEKYNVQKEERDV